jgi:hypothetical protein
MISFGLQTGARDLRDRLVEPLAIVRSCRSAIDDGPVETMPNMSPFVNELLGEPS